MSFKSNNYGKTANIMIPTILPQIKKIPHREQLQPAINKAILKEQW